MTVVDHSIQRGRRVSGFSEVVSPLGGFLLLAKDSRKLLWFCFLRTICISDPKPFMHFGSLFSHSFAL
ncbi:hypothetical protein Bca101_026874 [Brassica carinata]